MGPEIWTLDLVLVVALIGCTAGLGALFGRMMAARKAGREVDTVTVGAVAALTGVLALLALWVSTR